MDWLNYHHLLYFWVVARGHHRPRLRSTPPDPACHQQATAPARALHWREAFQASRTQLGPDGDRARGLPLRGGDFRARTRADRTSQGEAGARRLRLSVGVADVLPKIIAYRLLEPVLHLPEPVQLACDERGLVDLLADLAQHRLDVVLSDSPLSPSVNVRAYNHLLGECGVSILGSRSLARKFRAGFPQSLDDAPFLLPTPKSTLRRSLDQWFDSQSIRPDVRGEFDDSALLKEFGQAGVGLFPAPSAVEKETCRKYHVQPVGRLDAVRERFFAISIERRLRHPAVKAITEAAHGDLFRDG